MRPPEFTSISTRLVDSIQYITLNRPETRNAFDEVMISELCRAIEIASETQAVRVIVITGAGTAFSAGANIDWMRRMGVADFETNYQDALGLAQMLDAIATSPKPTVAKVNGPAIGGGTGIVAACDIAIGVDTSFFSFSEVKIGLVPACIAPHVMRKVGEGRSRELFITGRRIQAEEALQFGLLNFVAPTDKFEVEVEELLKQLLTSGPAAISSAKRLVRAIPDMYREESIAFTVRMIAELRTSKEGREGTAAFLAKRKPFWVA